MICFIDTSAIYALLDADDKSHKKATVGWKKLLDERATILTTNYVLVEIAFLLQSRLGIASIRAFYQDVMPLLTVEWLNKESHLAGVAALLSGGRAGISLVDHTSFEVMRNLGIRTAFTYDRHFREQGFEIV